MMDLSPESGMARRSPRGLVVLLTRLCACDDNQTAEIAVNNGKEDEMWAWFNELWRWARREEYEMDG